MNSMMPFVILYEGPTDLRFIDKLVTPRLQKSWRVRRWKFTTLKREQRIQIVSEAITKGNPVVYICDLDECQCEPERRDTECRLLKVAPAKCVAVVKREIEGWYLAGVPNEIATKLKIAVPEDTTAITKEQFGHMAQEAGWSVIELMSIILDHYDIGLAKVRNPSFGYFWRNWVDPYGPATNRPDEAKEVSLQQ